MRNIGILQKAEAKLARLKAPYGFRHPCSVCKRAENATGWKRPVVEIRGQGMELSDNLCQECLGDLLKLIAELVEKDGPNTQADL